ncbi:MAG: sulfatase-like hydrolase/transferase [Deltaproteobacteria bacterium]|nr:sulfatase-like hydrolase/transferase [Deltaproteobacteria bacterium]
MSSDAARTPPSSYTSPTPPRTLPTRAPKTKSPNHDYNKGTRETYVKMVERMDQGVGKITKALSDAGLTENTLFVFMSDNGANKTGDNSPYSGYKGNLFEGGIRVPCIAVWPGILAPGTTSDQPCITMDFSRSILAAVGTAPPPNRPFDGIDILAAVAANVPLKQRTLFWRARRAPWTRKAVRHGSLKYIRLQNDVKTQEYLFDLAADPAEKNNLLTQRPDQVRRLKYLLKAWEAEVRHKR